MTGHDARLIINAMAVAIGDVALIDVGPIPVRAGGVVNLPTIQGEIIWKFVYTLRKLVLESLIESRHHVGTPPIT